MPETHRNFIEDEAIHNIDRRTFKRQHRSELEGKGLATEQLVVDFFATQIPGFRSRFGNEIEDKGFKIGGKETDVVVYFEDQPALAIQLTGSESNAEKEKRAASIIAHPFIRLEEMKPTDVAIPRVLLLIEPMQTSSYLKNPNFESHPEISLKIIDQILANFQKIHSKSHIAKEQTNVLKLTEQLTEARKKFIQ